MEKIDRTIDAICEWIQEGLKTPGITQADSIIPELTKALAELVSARGNRINRSAS